MRTITALLFAVTVFTAAAKDDKLRQAMKNTDSIVWTGIDYSLMRMIGTPHTIKVPDLLFQDMPARWNDLFLDERIEGVAAALGKRIDIDIAGVTERNRQLSREQVILDKELKDAVKQTHITSTEISDAVKAIKSSRKQGLGLMFLVDRMVSEKKLVPTPSKIHKDAPPSYIAYAEALYVVFFNIETREVLLAKREVKPIGTGGSFRNFWFGAIKDVDSELSQYGN